MQVESPAQPVILEALLLPTVGSIHQIAHVAGVVIAVRQLLQVVKAGIRPRLHHTQAQGVGLIAPLAGQTICAVAVLVDQLRQLPLGVVGRRTHIRHPRQPAYAGQLADGVVAVGHGFALRPRIATRVG